MYCTGMCYQEGIGVEKNLQKAIHWLEKSAGEGWGAAMLELSFIHQDNKQRQEKYLIEAAALHQRQTNGGITLIEDIQRNVEALAWMLPYYTQLWRIHLGNKGKVGAEPLRSVLRRIVRMWEHAHPKPEERNDLSTDDLENVSMLPAAPTISASSVAALRNAAKREEWVPQYANPIGVLSLEELDIESVDLSRDPITSNLCNVLALGLPRFRLRLGGTWVKEPQVTEGVCAALPQVANYALMILQLPNAKLSEQAISALCAWFKFDKERGERASLAVLDLSGSLQNGKRDHEVFTALTDHSGLQSLSITACKLSSDSVQALAKLISSNPPLRSLTMNGCELGGDENQRLFAAALAANAKMGIEALKTIREDWDALPGLHGLSMADCKIGYEAQSLMAIALSTAVALRELNVQRNLFDAIPCEKLLENPNLTLLHVDMARLASVTFKTRVIQHKKLADLEISNECVCFSDCRCPSSLSEILSGNRSLRNIRVRAWAGNPYIVGDLGAVLARNATLNNLALHANFDLMDEQASSRHAAWAPVRAILARNTENDAQRVVNWGRVYVSVAFMRANITSAMRNSILPVLPTITNYHGVNTRILLDVDRFMNSRWFQAEIPSRIRSPQGNSSSSTSSIFSDQISEPEISSSTSWPISVINAEGAIPIINVVVPGGPAIPAPSASGAAAAASAPVALLLSNNAVNLGNFEDVPITAMADAAAGATTAPRRGKKRSR